MALRLAFLLFFASPFAAEAALPDSLLVRLEYSGTHAQKEFDPLYLSSDKFGVNDYGASGGFLRAGLVVPYKPKKALSWSAGLDAIYKPFRTATLQQAYVKAKWHFVEFRAGKIEETIGIDSVLSSGSLLQSANAMPMPRVTFSIPHFVSIPFTRGYLEIKGDISHSWLESDGVVKNAFLHQKSFSGRVGGDLPLNILGGLTHVAMWGGEHEIYGQLPASFEDFMIVFSGERGGENSLEPEAKNALGNHLGVVEYGAELKLPGYRLLVYNQIPFEDSSGLGVIRRDGLRGIELKSSKGGLFSAITYQYLSTTHQSGSYWLPPSVPGGEPQPNYSGNDNFYNNYLYRNGWTYQGRVIGSPLFHSRLQAANDFGMAVSAGPGIANNRIKAHHLGIESYVIPSVRLTTLVCWSRNYGSYETPYQKAGGEQQEYFEQWYLMSEVKYNVFPRLEVVGRAAVDFGEIYDNYGFSLSVIFSSPVRTNAS